MNNIPMPFHCLVWIDHTIARIYGVQRDGLREIAVIHAPDQDHGHIHHRAGTRGSGHEPPAAEFLEKTASAIKDGAEILIAGPAEAKHALKRHIALHAPRLASHIIGVETLADCGTRELHDFAAAFFHRADRMQSPAP